jgi:hypothetical protein
MSEKVSFVNRLAEAAELTYVKNHSRDKTLRVKNVLDIVRKLEFLGIKFFENKL